MRDTVKDFALHPVGRTRYSSHSFLEKIKVMDSYKVLTYLKICVLQVPVIFSLVISVV